MQQAAQASSALLMGRSLNAAVSRYWWTLDRFGLTPQKLVARIDSAGEPKILCVSLPKAGTHLLERALCLHPKLYRKLLPTIDPSQLKKRGDLDSLLSRLKPGQIIAAHLAFRPDYRDILAARGVRTIFLVRDPRDIVVSAAHYLAREKAHVLYPLFSSQSGIEQRIKLVITGNSVPRLEPMSEHLSDFAGWLQASDMVVRFEDLIGAQGGGDVGVQRATLSSLYRAVGMSPDEAFIDSVARRLFSSDSPTFRKGAIGQWKQHFTPDLLELFRTAVDDEVVRYGYKATALP